MPQRHEDIEDLGGVRVAKAAALLDVSERDIWRRVYSGELAYFKVGRLVRVKLEALRALMNREAA